MSEVMDLIHNYKLIRDRLICPKNAVFDEGIDLHRKRIPPLSPSKTVLGYQPTCKVTILTVPKPPIEPVVPRVVKFRTLRKAVCRHYQIQWKYLKGKIRNSRICLPRHVLCYLAYHHTGLTLHQIARQLGGKDHTTILHGHNKIRDVMLVDDILANTIKLIEFEVFAGYYDTDDNILGSAESLCQANPR